MQQHEACPAKLAKPGGVDKRSTGFLIIFSRDRLLVYFVYLLRSIDFPNQIYVGYTTDVQQRFQAHNFGGSLHTSKYKPWKLHGYFAFADKYRALEFECYLKSHAGKAFASKRLW